MKIKKAYKHIIFALEKTGTAAGKDVYGWKIIEKGAPQPDDQNEVNFKALVKSLPEGEPRFVVYDFTETKADGRLIKKRAFFLPPHFYTQSVFLFCFSALNLFPFSTLLALPCSCSHKVVP